jgi:hypothetical protein
VKKLLLDHCTYKRSGGEVIAKSVAEKLVADKWVGVPVTNLEPGATDRLISSHGEEHVLLWTFRDGRVMRLRQFDTFDAARSAESSEGAAVAAESPRQGAFADEGDGV